MTKPTNNRTALPNRFWRFALAALCVLSLSACVDRDMSDLQRYVKDVLARKAPVIPEIPTFPPYQLYAYSSSDGKDPFKPFFEKPVGDIAQPMDTGPCEGPVSDRLREELEAYPLDSLRMVGTIEQQEELYGVVLSSEGAIHRVALDNFMGRNHGRIIDIREEAIELIEIVLIPDGKGCWQERSTEIALIE